MSGDKFNLSVSSWWNGTSVPDAPHNPLNDLISAMANNIGTMSGSHSTPTELINSGALTQGITDFLSKIEGLAYSDRPRAFVNWLMLDEQFKYVEGSGFEQVGAGAGADVDGPPGPFSTHVRTNMLIPKNGYLYIYVSNATPNIDVFFDNLQVTHIRGPLIETNEYYSFGLKIAALSSESLSFGKPTNRNKYQQYEYNKDLDINLYETFYRSHDPQTGRFLQLDPKPTDFESLYTAMGNNPIRNIDILGDSIGPNRTKPVNIYIVPVAKDNVIVWDTRRLQATKGKYETLLLHSNNLDENAATTIKKFLGDDGYINTMVVDYHRTDYDKMSQEEKDNFYKSLSEGYAGDKTNVLLGMCWAGGLDLSVNDPDNLPDLTIDISKQLDKATVYGLKTEANSVSFNSSGNFGVLNPVYIFGSNKWARHERAFESDWSVSSFNPAKGEYVTNHIYKAVSLTLKGVISVTAPTTITSTDIPFK